MMVRVAVVGAGVIGVSSALKIKEKYPGFEVIIISKEFTPLTTGDGSGGLWYPYIVGNNPSELINKWGLETYRFMHQAWLQGGLNISLLPIYYLKKELHDSVPTWADQVFGFHQFDKKQLKYFSDLYSASPEFVQGHYFTTFVVPPQVVIPYLMRRFQKAGGKIVEAAVRSLRDDMLSPFDVVVNCTGVKAREIVPDGRVFPVRGQVLKVEAPWITQCVMDEGGLYIIPNKWGLETYRFMHQAWLQGGLNISLLPIYYLKKELHDSVPTWADQVFGFHQFDKKQLKYFSDLYSASPEFVQGHYFTTFVVPPQVVIPYLMRRFQKAGGKIVEAAVRSLRDDMLSPFDVVVNCTGVKAREIVPDGRVFPVRGQVLKVEAPWITQCVMDEGGLYIIPNHATCVLGGTHQENDYSTQLNDKDTEFIVNGCRRILPGLQNAKIVGNWAGLRPARDVTRLEAEKADGKLYIHNYGHGGSGFTLFWGCATDVVQLLETNLNVKSRI